MSTRSRARPWFREPFRIPEELEWWPHPLELGQILVTDNETGLVYPAKLFRSCPSFSGRIRLVDDWDAFTRAV
jgi:hypothetical protein